MTEAKYPILEFDPTKEAMIEPARVIRQRDVPEHCVICFFNEVIDEIAAEVKAKIVVTNQWEDGPHLIYEMDHGGRRLAFLHPGVGAPLAAAMLEERRPESRPQAPASADHSPRAPVRW